MRTQDLISLMVAGQRPVDTGWLGRATLAAAGASLAAAFALVVATLGPRPDLLSGGVAQASAMKAAFGGAVAVVALWAFLRSLRPGARAAHHLVWLAVPLVAVGLFAAFDLAQAPAGAWSGIVFGRNWLACLIAVPLYALAPLALLIAVAREGAPLRPRLTGIAAGVAAAGLATVAYSIHCPEDAAPFLATWYPLAMAAMGALGALLVPRFVRW